MSVDLNGAFNTAIDSITIKVTGTDSIYDKTLAKLDALYTTLGMSAADRNKIIAEVSAQLAVSTTNSAINAAVEIAKSSILLDAQVGLINKQSETETNQALDIVAATHLKDAQKAFVDKQADTETNQAALVQRQIDGFDDKLKVEVMKTMGGIGQMEATSGTTQAGTLLAINRSMNITLQAAGMSGFTFTEV